MTVEGRRVSERNKQINKKLDYNQRKVDIWKKERNKEHNEKRKRKRNKESICAKDRGNALVFAVKILKSCLPYLAKYWPNLLLTVCRQKRLRKGRKRKKKI